MTMKPVTRKIKDYVIPHEGNDYKPHLLRPRAIIFFCAVMVAVELVALLGVPYMSTHSRLFGIIAVNALADGTNANRITDGLPTLATSPLLQAAAQEKANDMAKNDYFAHTSPAGITPWYWFLNVGYDFSYAGENLAVNFSDSQDVTNAWMNSPEHRANILGANYTNIGIAVATGTYEGQPATFVVELFGTPAIAPIAITSPPAQAEPVRAVATVKPTSKPAVVSVASVPAIVFQTTTPQAAAVAVKGASTENLPATSTAAQAKTVPAVFAPAVPSAVSPSEDATEQNNPVQEAFASPRKLSNDFYFLLITLIAGALLLNIFIKIRIQHPQLIANGIFVIALAALCIVLNQHQLLAHAVIF
jgi:uncharacterized protein YkwD